MYDHQMHASMYHWCLESNDRSRCTCTFTTCPFDTQIASCTKLAVMAWNAKTGKFRMHHEGELKVKYWRNFVTVTSCFQLVAFVTNNSFLFWQWKEQLVSFSVTSSKKWVTFTKLLYCNRCMFNSVYKTFSKERYMMAYTMVTKNERWGPYGLQIYSYPVFTK